MTDDTPWLARFPVTFFTMVMGLSGLTLALAMGERVLGWTTVMSTAAYMLTVVVFTAIAVVYLTKGLRHPRAVKAEWDHPVSLAFFPAISISLLLLAAATLDWSREVATVIWLIGVALQFVLTLAVISGWIGARSFEHGHLTPAWFVPAVGNVIAPIAGAPLGFVEISWFFLSIGLLFWIVLLAMVVNRLVFHDPLPERLQPTLVIMIAPPAVACLGWVALNPQGGVMDRIFMNVALFFLAVVLVQVPRLMRLEFSLSFWALSFPLAGLTTATLGYGAKMDSAFHTGLGLCLLVALVVVMIGLVVRTAYALMRGTAF